MMTEEIFGKIEGMMEEENPENLNACEFYLEAFLNQNVQLIEMLKQLKISRQIKQEQDNL